MATAKTTDSKPKVKLRNWSDETDKRVRKLLQGITQLTKNRSTFRSKLDEIDMAYARYLTAAKRKDLLGMAQYGKVSCGAMTPVSSPIVISQVQSMVAYWSEVFLSGYPIFPVVSTPDLRNEAEALEGIIQDHLVMTESIPELQRLFNYGARYNQMIWDTEWAPISTYQPSIDSLETDPTMRKLQKQIRHVNRIIAIDPRNAHIDMRVQLPNNDSYGEFAGYSEVWNRTRLKDFLNYLTHENKLTTSAVVDKALASEFASDCYFEPPILSEYDQGDRSRQQSWDSYGGFTDDVPVGMRAVGRSTSNTYLVTKMYLRILPSDFLMSDVPNKNTVQTWVCYMVNNEHIISMEPYYGPYGRFGVGSIYPLEDGLEEQTQSYGEMAAPLQDAVTKLFNIRFQQAHRALQDRAVYNPALIRAADVNSPFMGSKIPVIADALTEFDLSRAYYPIPFNSQGTETVLQDAMIITDWQKELSGQNNATRGQMTKGNRTLGEFSSIMGSAENRLRLPALVIETRMMAKIKEVLKLNILMFGQDTEVVSPRTGIPLQVSIENLQKVNLQFQLADGYTPKSKMANTDFLTALMNMISQSQVMQQAVGMQLPAMLAHLAQLGGVNGFDIYARMASGEYMKNISIQQEIQGMLQQLVGQQAGGKEGGNGAA